MASNSNEFEVKLTVTVFADTGADAVRVVQDRMQTAEAKPCRPHEDQHAVRVVDMFCKVAGKVK